MLPTMRTARMDAVVRPSVLLHRTRSNHVPRCTPETKPDKLDNPINLVPTSCVFYAGMTVAAVQLGATFDTPVGPQLFEQVQLIPTATSIGVLLAVALVTQRYTDRVPALKEIETLMRLTLLPALRTSPWWAVPLLALGAGVGEEALFRGLLQQGLELKFETVVDAHLADALSLAAASLVFGLAHALNWAYFSFATLGGIIFGLEYKVANLSSAAASHFLYDWVGLWAFLEVERGAQWAVDLKTLLQGSDKEDAES